MVETALKLTAVLTRAKNKLRRSPARSRTPSIEAADVQGLVFRGYGALPLCCYPLLRITDPAGARRWLRELAARISPGLPAARDTAVHVAFTCPGLSALGLGDEVLQAFSRTFIEGMATPHRSRFLGDDAESSPERWQWGGPASAPVHAVLPLFASTADRLKTLLDAMRRSWTAHGLVEIRTLETTALRRTEHFGFADGLSQPSIEGYHSAPSPLHQVKPGEFLLGYPNEYGLYTERPLLEARRDPRARLPLDVEGSPRRDLGRNGTYLVVRQLRQDVPAFRATLDALTRNADGSANPIDRERLAAQMVGRWRSGTSLIVSPDGDDVSKAKYNEFRYHQEDAPGLKCPIGSHVRRANPRDALAPHPGTDDSLRINHRHRLIRRGRSYGPPLAEDAVDTADRGLMFIAVNANISRQFEFVQHSWIIDPRFNGLERQADPVMAATSDNQFATPAHPVRTLCTDLPRFVTVAGGAYFFMPGIAALRFLGELEP
jgi:Dyp-type peroxidase family